MKAVAEDVSRKVRETLQQGGVEGKTEDNGKTRNRQEENRGMGIKMISWNVNGLRACMQKGFMEYFRQADADVFCL